MKKSFFLVWNPESGYTRFQHESYYQAENEARRMAELHHGKHFMVLAAVCDVVKSSVIVEQFDVSKSLDEIPF